MKIARRHFSVFFALFLSIGLLACSNGSTSGNTRSSAERDDDMAIGDPKAPIVMFEYASLTCPHCAEFHETVFPALKKEYIDTGKVRFIFRQLPTPPVPFAVGAEAVARCAGPDKYFDLLDILYQKQSYWIRSSNPRKTLMEIAATAGISQDQFDACVSDQANVKRIQDISTLAREKFNITGTPSFVINGKARPLVKGRPVVLEDFTAIFDPILGGTSETTTNEKEETQESRTKGIAPVQES